jgi:hypothetical protein
MDADTIPWPTGHGPNRLERIVSVLDALNVMTSGPAWSEPL